MLGAGLILASMAGCATTHELGVGSRAPDNVRVGDELRVTLDANPTTGYVWQRADTATNLLRQIGPIAYETPSARSGLYGAPVKMVARFKAIAPGAATLRLVYVRPLEAVAPAQQFERIVEIAP